MTITSRSLRWHRLNNYLNWLFTIDRWRISNNYRLICINPNKPTMPLIPMIETDTTTANKEIYKHNSHKYISHLPIDKISAFRTNYRCDVHFWTFVNYL